MFRLSRVYIKKNLPSISDDECIAIHRAYPVYCKHGKLPGLIGLNNKV